MKTAPETRNPTVQGRVSCEQLGSQSPKQSSPGRPTTQLNSSVENAVSECEIWRLQKGAGTVVAAMRVYEGTRFLDIRLWHGGEQIRPSRKGITIPIEAASDLARTLLEHFEQQTLTSPDA